MDCSSPHSSVLGISQAKILEWIIIPFSRGSSQPSDWTWVSHIAGRFFTISATREAPYYFRTLISSEDILDHFNSLASNYTMKISSWPIYDCKRLWHTTFGPLSWHPCDIFYHYCHTPNYSPKLVSFVIYSLLRKYSRKWRNFYQTSLFYSASFSKGHFFPLCFWLLFTSTLE